MSLFCY